VVLSVTIVYRLISDVGGEGASTNLKAHDWGRSKGVYHIERQGLKDVQLAISEHAIRIRPLQDRIAGPLSLFHVVNEWPQTNVFVLRIPHRFRGLGEGRFSTHWSVEC